jgi:hypothetical protein
MGGDEAILSVVLLSFARRKQLKLDATRRKSTVLQWSQTSLAVALLVWGNLLNA